MRISPEQVEELTLYEAIVYWRRLRREQELEYIQKLHHAQLVAMAVRDPENYAKLVDEAMAEGGIG